MTHRPKALRKPVQGHPAAQPGPPVSQASLCSCLPNSEASLVAQTVKNLPAMQKTQVQSQGWEDPLEKEMATHSSILAWRIPWTEDPSGLHTVHRVAKSRTQVNNLTIPNLIFNSKHNKISGIKYSVRKKIGTNFLWLSKAQTCKN